MLLNVNVPAYGIALKAIRCIAVIGAVAAILGGAWLFLMRIGDGLFIFRRTVLVLLGGIVATKSLLRAGPLKTRPFLVGALWDVLWERGFYIIIAGIGVYWLWK